MKIKVVDEPIKYTGAELAPHWIYKKFHILGDAAVAFIGECEVNLTEMVDIEDVINNEPIYSKSMINIILEHFNINLPEGVLRQRLLITTIKEYIEQNYPDVKIRRNGDDIFINDKKLTVSIATKSINSVLIHTGINIDPTGAPVNASGLQTDLNVTDCKKFAKNILENYKNEIADIKDATCKVRGVMEYGTRK
ncbi:MAG: DUF366 family protein [Candidatus Gastranaerophilales bacterium]|nr:DUF366 family protein [Candidatus Gastranaerophilales bacterium]